MKRLLILVLIWLGILVAAAQVPESTIGVRPVPPMVPMTGPPCGDGDR